ncbi:MAG: hypothetical protein U5Q44_01665 [Dehalococcoidia bacterium]|nr:hypothetical protein [Dehalococcoidia bacterium]
MHAWRITVPHPDGAMLTVTSPIPGDMRTALHGFGFGESAMQYCQPVEPQLIDPAAPPID